MVVDIRGNDIFAGDIIAYARRDGNLAMLELYEVRDILPQEKDSWGMVWEPVVAVPVLTRYKRDNFLKEVKLHGELFKHRAIMVGDE